MAQAMIDNLKYKKKLSSKSEHLKTFDFTFNFTNYKSVRIYYSKSYRDFVLSLNLGNSKKFIITKSMWKIFKIYFSLIDKLLSNETK